MKLSDNGFDLVPGEKHVVSVEELPQRNYWWTYLCAPAASMVVGDSRQRCKL